MKKKYKICLVGLGNISKKHIEAITLSKYFTLVAIFDFYSKIYYFESNKFYLTYFYL